jgi:hypothetical protein
LNPTARRERLTAKSKDAPLADVEKSLTCAGDSRRCPPEIETEKNLYFFRNHGYD